MAVSPTPPSLSVLPPAPLPTDAEAVFDAKAGARLTAEEVMVAEQNAALAWQAGSMAETKAYKDAAATSAGNAADSATLAGQKVGLAVTARQGAEAARASSEVIAASVQAAAGTPSLIGNGGKALCAKLDETGVEFKPLGQAIGDIIRTARIPDATYLPANTVYLQSSYPELFAKLGALPNISSTSAVAGTLPAGCGSVAFGNGIFVATPSASASGNTAYTSPDGITWTARTLPTSSYWQAVTYGGGLFVAVGQSSIAIATSPDGITWTARTVPGGNPGNPINIGYGNGRFVITPFNSAVGMTSTDGITWTTTNFQLSGYWYAIAYGNGVFVAMSSGGNFTTSINGTTWTLRTLPLGVQINSVSFGNGKFVAVTPETEGLVLVSSDGITWTYKALTAGAPYLGRVVFGAGLFIIIPSNTASYFCWISMDGINWIVRALARSAIWTWVTYGNDKFVAVATTAGNTSLPLYSYDKATQFTTPEVIPVLGVTTYIKAKVA